MGVRFSDSLLSSCHLASILAFHYLTAACIGCGQSLCLGGGGGGYENFPKSHPQYLGTKLQCSLPVQGFAVGNNSLLQRAMGGSYTCISSPGSLYLNWPQLPADMPCVQDRQRDDASWPKTWLWALCRHNSCTLIGSIMGVWWLNLRSKGIPVVHSSSPFQ